MAKDYQVAVQQYWPYWRRSPENNDRAQQHRLVAERAWRSQIARVRRTALSSLRRPRPPSLILMAGYWRSVGTRSGVSTCCASQPARPDDTEIRLHLAKALLKTGDKAAAKSEL